MKYSPPVACISAIAYELPEKTLTNEDLQRENPDWDMSRLAGKTGIVSRRIAAPDECASDLAFRAAEKLLNGLGADRSSIDTLLFCTQSPDHYLPATACILQHRLGLPVTCAALDFNQGCSGFIYGLFLAKALIAAGQSRRILLLTGDTYSKFIHPRDRSVRVLFGDVAAATLVSSEYGAPLGEFSLGTDGEGAQNLIVPVGGARRPACLETSLESTDHNGSTRTPANLFMDGQEVFEFTLQRVPGNVDAALAKASLTRDQIDWYIFHQANKFVLDQLRSRLKIPAVKVPFSFETTGNTVSSTIPITLNEFADKFTEGNKLLLVGFGVGYSWGACDVTWHSSVRTF
jgi:3-oxoacyl-[acyl-carrier-protein] synthase-3